ncbi:hypothetical protein [Melittangium boletus]|uniref:Uncharacterized protein n=1 Tax=Melittangium boletus DSM 14713 TaxID=1294270 RepID=A0A250IN56_9BACT|nr:hypothetical protein [Melittangium boletus]ATB33174.1 hypothetical protein MEBOL_006663 [Melittangium boletus DSM 14713]
MDLTPLLIALLPVLLVFAVGLMGSTRRLGFWPTVVLSVVLTPIGGGLVAILSGPKRLKKKRASSRDEDTSRRE